MVLINYYFVLKKQKQPNKGCFKNQRTKRASHNYSLHKWSSHRW